jgi:hypothetical protein
VLNTVFSRRIAGSLCHHSPFETLFYCLNTKYDGNIISFIGNGIRTDHNPLADGLIMYVNAAGKKMYTELPTYRIIVVDQCSRNLEPRSHPHFATFMSQAEPLPPLERVFPNWRKFVPIFCHFNLRELMLCA